MITERKDDLIITGAESFIDKLLEKYLTAKLGDRIGEVDSGETNSQAGRDGNTDSEGIGNIVQQPPIGQPRG